MRNLMRVYQEMRLIQHVGGKSWLIYYSEGNPIIVTLFMQEKLADEGKPSLHSFDSFIV